MERSIEIEQTQETDMKVEMVVIAEHGLGFGDGSISTHAQMESGELTREALVVAHEVITENEGVFTDIDADITDDGCGDGRPAVDTWVTDEDGQEIHYNKSYPRAKIFGGGLVVASSMWRAIMGSPESEDSVLGDRAYMATKLAEKQIAYGGHSDEHAHGDACGCGAIDKYPDISQNIVKYEPQIRGTLQALYGANYSATEGAINRVFEGYLAISGSEYFADAAGKRTMDLMTKDGAVIKKLGGGHQEDVIVLNDIEGTTFDQPAFDAELKSRGVDETVQAFVVDIWRGRMYADAVSDIALEHGVHGTKRELAETAYADFLIRTLAVAATLTGGDLPVFARRRQGQKDFALAA